MLFRSIKQHLNNIFFSSEHIFGHTKPNEPHSGVFGRFDKPVLVWCKANDQKGKQKSPGRATNRSRSRPLTPGSREKVTQFNVCIVNQQMHDTHKDQLPLPQAR